MRGFGFGVMVSASVLGMAVAAQAGGYTQPVVEPAVTAPVVASVQDWRGPYVGLILGYAFGADDRVGLSDGSDTYPSGENLKLNGAEIGLRAGYRWQSDRWVFGPELSLEGGDVKDSFRAVDEDDDVLAGDTKLKRMVALRLKAGRLLDEQTLLYGIAGVAQAKFDYDVSFNQDVWNLDHSFSRTGYVVGLGVERKLTERISLTGEYEYANFGKKTLEGEAGITTEATPKFSTVKIGVNFNF